MASIPGDWRGTSGMHAGINPFAAQRMHALPFVFADGETGGALSARFWRGVAAGGLWQVLVGPHGSGKSTLLRELGAMWAAQGCEVMWLSGGERGGRVRAWSDLAGEAERPASGPLGSASGLGDMAGRRVLLVDSGERLTATARFRWWWSWGRCPVLMTVHREWGQRVLYRCRPRLEVFLALCDRLLVESGLGGVTVGGAKFGESSALEPGAAGAGRGQAWDREFLERVFTEHGGDMRASFFALYERASGADS